MDEDYAERLLSILRGGEGCYEQYSSISEFKGHLNEAALAEKELDYGWVMWKANERYEQQQIHLYHLYYPAAHNLQHKIKTLLDHFASCYVWCHGLVQFWGVVKEEGRHHYLSTSNYPFSFHKHLCKGFSWYRKLCMDLVYVVDVDGPEDEQLIGGVGRVYRNKQPESTPDLRLYSTKEFPLRDEAARCGFIAYMALPLFDLQTNECYGVLELLSKSPAGNLFSLDQGLEIARLRSTHRSYLKRKDTLARYEQPDNEISEILALAIKAVPRLSLAQVWIPCKQCPIRSCTNLCCMEMASFISTENKKVTSDSFGNIYDYDMLCYLRACEFHNLQIDLSCFLKNMSDLSISKFPLAHYANKARLSHCFAICLQSVNNSKVPIVIQFFLQLKNKEDACGDSSLHLLLRIIQMKLKSLKIVSVEQLPNKLVVKSSQLNIAIECESIDMLNVMNSYKETFSQLDFTKYLETSCPLRPSFEKVGDGGWVFCSLVGEELIDNDVQGDLLNVPSWTKYKIEQFMKKIVVKSSGEYWIIQFWTPKMVENRYRLETIDQPFVVGCLAKGLASFRKEYIKHHYMVDEEAKEEELGPPGRVFRSEHPEIAPNLFLYSTKEFSMRNYAWHCHLEKYFALPVFDKQEHKCVGVLEFIGIVHGDWCAKDIEETLKVANLSTSYIDMRPRSRADDIPVDIAKALTEIKGAFYLICKIPQLYLAKVWVPHEKCASINCNVKYMELTLTTEYLWEESYTHMVHWITNVQSKKGMIGMVLESENKCCFCQNLSEFSIVDEQLALVERKERLDVCFAVCLQSSHTGDVPYVLEFFLNPSINDLPFFFNFLLPILKQQLPSFKYSSGKQLGDELVVEVIEFSEANNALSELGQLDVFPIKFKRVQYGQTEHQQAEEESVHCVSDARQTEQGNIVVVSDLNKTNRGQRKINLHLSLDNLKQHFGKKLKDVAEELGVGRSTIKRACREYGIDRWPRNKKQARNPSLFERRAQDQNVQPSSSSSLQLWDTSLHQNVARTITESTQPVLVQKEAEKVMVRVKHEEDTIKFELCLSLGVSKLFEEVVRRLNLETGCFKLKYVDEDNEEILIACDDDLHLCPKNQTATGKTCIQLFIPK